MDFQDVGRVHQPKLPPGAQPPSVAWCASRVWLQNTRESVSPEPVMERAHEAGSWCVSMAGTQRARPQCVRGARPGRIHSGHSQSTPTGYTRSLHFPVRAPELQEGCPQPKPGSADACPEKRLRSQNWGAARCSQGVWVAESQSPSQSPPWNFPVSSRLL